MNIFKKVLDFIMEILETVTFVGSIFIVIYLFIMQPNQVKGASMEPTFFTGDYIFTSKVTYKFRPVERGDVVVFHSPKNPDIEFIKRIIALPGDKFEVISGKVLVNDEVINEEYIAAQTVLWEGGFIQDSVPITVPEDEVFVMGDNRPRSSDSREFGPVKISSIIGQVFYQYYPLQKMHGIKNPFPPDLRVSRLERSLAFK